MPRKKVQIFPLFEEVRRVTSTLTDAQFGKAIRIAFSKYYDGIEQKEDDGVVSLAAAMLMEQAARYDAYRGQQRENRTGNRNQNTTKEHQGTPNATNGNQGVPRVSPNPNPNPDPLNSIMCSKAVDLLNTLSGSSFRANTKSTQRLIAARENEGYSLADIEMVIRHQCELWGKDEKMRKYLRPETLFGNKFEGYLSEAERCGAQQEPGYILAPLEDPWDVAVREGKHA